MSAAYEFCRECSSWFCPHASSWMYEGNEEAIAAWSDEPEPAPEPDEPEQQQEIVW